MAIRDSRRRRGPARCVVTAVSRPTPRMVRVQLRGDDLVGVEPTGPDQRVKLAFPAGRTFGDDPAEAASARRRRRTYTLLDLDPAAGTAALEFVVHGSGIAGPWATQARPGDELDVTGPVGGYEIDPSADEHLLICDETGIPAARAILRALAAAGANGVSAHVEIPDEHERSALQLDDIGGRGSLGGIGRVDIDWLVRADRPHGEPMTRLAQTLSCSPLAQVWIAGEAEAVRALRTRVVAGLGLDRRRVSAVAYWTAGHAEGDPATGRPGEHV